MLSIEELKKNDPEIEKLSDDELLKLRDKLYPIIEKILDLYFAGIASQSRSKDLHK